GVGRVHRCLSGHALPLPVYVLAQARGVGWHEGQARSASLCPSNPPEMGDRARCARVWWRRPKSHRFAGVIVEGLGRNLAGGQHPTHLCHHATRFLHTKVGTYKLFRTNFGCPEEDGGLEQVLYSITKHAMRRSADEIGATSISFRPKVFSDPALTEFFCE